MSEHLEVKILVTGKAVARRKDNLPLTEADRAVVRQLAADLRAQSQRLGITVADVLRVFPGSRLVEKPIEEPKPSCCSHCGKDSVPPWRRGGKIVQNVGSDGTRFWACIFCGRRFQNKHKKRGD